MKKKADRQQDLFDLEALINLKKFEREKKIAPKKIVFDKELLRIGKI
jgi:hypothetical protein